MSTSLESSESLKGNNETFSFKCLYLFSGIHSKQSSNGFMDNQTLGASYIPNPTYAISVQRTPRFKVYREQNYEWMVKTCTNRKFLLSVAYTGMNYFDRYLSVVSIDTHNVELLSWACIYLSSVVIGNRLSCISIGEISEIVNDTYSPESIVEMVTDLLCVLSFYLYPSSPYLVGEEILFKAGFDSVIPSFYSLLNEVCMKYSSIGVSSCSIAYICVLVAWCYSYPNVLWPQSLVICEESSFSDYQYVIQISKEIFPVVTDVCTYIVSILSMRKCKDGISPTNIC